MSVVIFGEQELKLNEDLLWESDWNGDEVGYDDIPVVGLYRFKHVEGERYCYIDMENTKILEVWGNYE